MRALVLVLVACGGGEPEPTGTVTINEILAHNLANAVDEAGEHEDWLELYNPTAVDVDLTGWTLVDEFGEGQPWSFPDGLVVGAGDFALLWCDATPDQGELHTSFELNYDGESLLLFDDAGAFVEETRYAILDIDDSWARVPDGGDLWQHPEHPTPGEANGS